MVYCTPSLHIAGGVERVLTQKANYFAEHFGYDITVILTDGKGKPNAFPLSEKIKVINLNIGFEDLWSCSFVKKIFVYLKKQRKFRKALNTELMRLRPDITVSMLRREVNFINEIKDGSKKIGEMHINRANYRNFDSEGAGWVKRSFAKVWSHNLIAHLKKLDKMVVLTEKDAEAWTELHNVTVIPNPLAISSDSVSMLTEKRVLAVARYSHEKGIDMLLKAWTLVEKQIKDWRLDVFGDGDRGAYEQLRDSLGIDSSRCTLHGRTNNVEKEYEASSLFVLSSRFEGFGMVIVEAMACGLPVVSFDCPWGPRSIIKDGEDGLLAENGNINDLANCLLKVMGDERLCQSMSQAGLRNVRRFNIQNIAERWRLLFESL